MATQAKTSTAAGPIGTAIAGGSRLLIIPNLSISILSGVLDHDPPILLALSAYLTAAIGMLLALIHEERQQAYESTPLTWPWVVALAVAWPVVIYELLAADGAQDGR